MEYEGPRLYYRGEEQYRAAMKNIRRFRDVAPEDMSLLDNQFKRYLGDAKFTVYK